MVTSGPKEPASWDVYIDLLVQELQKIQAHGTHHLS